jgi:hypothetical protein
MKIGDNVKMSERNPNHLGNSVDAYAGMEGIVTNIYEDGAFVLNCGSSILVVPMNNAYKQPKKGLWIWLNGEHVFHRRNKDTKRVIARMHKTYSRKSDEYTETLIQYLQEKIDFKIFGIKIFCYWKTIDKETVPSYAWIQRNTLGFTDWKSKWAEMANVKWVN